MELTIQEFKRCTLVTANGRIDGSNAPRLADAMKDITDRNIFKIVFDMSNISFMASAGWWIMIETQKLCKRYNRGEVVLVNINPVIQNSLNIVGMGTYFKIYQDVVSAVAYF